MASSALGATPSALAVPVPGWASTRRERGARGSVCLGCATGSGPSYAHAENEGSDLNGTKRTIKKKKLAPVVAGLEP